ncbi:uncharacterized protein LOC125675697 [Ostrea edulis]|uniref:uncharacterized protein LOC125675697 n=1 Tax=Ostrea edulis TaxID=37623 RepID=UPI0024AF5E0A|nr:uncharacterized protein LOC125675697 [Ostrea edulis]
MNMNVSNSSIPPEFTDQELFDRYQFVRESPGVAISLIVILLLAGLIGTCGNVLILLALCVMKNMKSLESIFIANLAISDMYVTLVADTMSIVAKLEGENFFNLYPGLCQFIAYGCTMSCVNSLGTIALMSFNRYVYICHNRYYNKIFKKYTCVMMCVSLYCVGLLLVLLNLAGIGDHSFDRKSLECIWDRMATYYYTVAFSVTLVWIPVVVTGFSYLNIYITVTKSTKRINKHQTREQPSTSSIKLARTLFIIYAVFATCWIPYALIIVVDRHDTFSHEAHLYVTVFAHLHPSINWLVYYFTNTKFRHAFDKIAGLHRVFGIFRQSPTEDVNSSRVLSTSDSQAKQKMTSIATLSSGDELSSRSAPQENMESAISKIMNISNHSIPPEFTDQGVFDRYQFVTESPGVAISLIIILLLAGLIGTFGNVLILLAICVMKNMKSLESIFIANLAISDIYVTIVADTMSIVAKLEGENFFNLYPGLCQFIAYGCTMACVNSLGTIGLMSFNRYVYICHKRFYTKIFKKYTCVMMCIWLYCVGLLLVLINLAGIGDHSFDRKSLECIWDRMATYYYTVAFSVTLVWIPVVVTGFSYLNIYITVTKSSKRINKHQTREQLSTSSIKLARTLFIIYAVFTVCWIPYALLVVLDRHDTFSHEVHLYITVFAHLHPSINWLVYYFTNSKFHQAFDKIVGLHRVCGIFIRATTESVESSEAHTPRTSDSQAKQNMVKKTTFSTLPSSDKLSSGDDTR